MSRFLRYEPCPKCRERGRDNRGDNLAVYDDGSAHCYSCRYHKRPTHYVPPPEKDDHDTKGVLPADFTREVPAAGWKWLLQYGLPYSYWKPYTGYSEKHNRLILTVGDPVQCAVGRLLEEPTRERRKWRAFGDSHRTAHVIGYDNPAAEERVVLVEDLISAHKVGQCCATIPLFGTNIFDSVVSTLRHIALPVTIWLDKDQEGVIVQRQAMRLSMYINQEVSYVFTKNDPKELTLAAIRDTLSLPAKETATANPSG